ncbi:MAG: hypothetical protein ABIP97_10285 [Chthoniobacterales bacterium]
MAFLYEEALSHLQRALKNGRLGHAYLISGPSKSGKQKLAETLSGLLMECPPEEVETHDDVHSARPESKSRRIVVSQIRDLEHAMHQKALHGKRKIAIIYDADRLQPQAANAFLKTLEEPPPESHVFLVSSQPEMLLDTILSRCIEVPLRRPDERIHTEAELKLLETFKKLIPKISQAGVQEAMLFTRSFQSVLDTLKTQTLESFEEEIAHEKSLYKQNTDGAWLAEREEQLKARAEAALQQERGRLLHFVSFLFGAALRYQQDSDLILPKEAADTVQALAQALSGFELIQRMESLDELAQSLERNTNEALALEVGFLRAFAPIK